ncbi:MAG: hypothetical protein P1U77_22170 [Rubripirellula sp.]|nr:hypothetical protein [Rubripirellula sp.]
MPIRNIAEVISAEIIYVSRELDTLIPVSFVIAWFQSRSYRRLFFGVPAILSIGILVVGVSVSFTKSKPRSLTTVLGDAIQAKDEGNIQALNFFLREARYAEDWQADASFAYAMLLSDADRKQEAAEVIRKLAPLNAPGYPRAQTVMITSLRMQASQIRNLDYPSEEQVIRLNSIMEEIEQRHRRILESVPNDLRANEFLASISLRRGEYAEAQDHLGRVVDASPQKHLLLAKVLHDSGEITRARSEAQAAVNYHSQMLTREELSQQEVFEHEIALAEGFVLLNAYGKALHVLMPEGDPLPQEPVRRKTLGRILFGWSESIEPSDDGALIHRIKLLSGALELIPEDARLLVEIAQFVGSCGAVDEQAREALKPLLATGTAPSIVQLILGVQAFFRGDDQEAMRHWEIANGIMPETSVILNNLAVLVAGQESPDLYRSLGLVNHAIDLQPENEEFYESRGVILMRLDQPMRAIADFERALSGLPGRKDIHGRLAKAYAVIGDFKMSELHNGCAVDANE